MWQRLGSRQYEHAGDLLLLCDCGGSNGYRQYLFKEKLAKQAYDLELPIEVAHYPPGCSKYNSIECRMFCHVTQALKGVVLRTIQIARDFISGTSTQTGLRVVEIARRAYYKGRKPSIDFLNDMPIQFNEFLPDLNYKALTF